MNGPVSDNRDAEAGVSRSVSALVASVIDYAGLFPPAKLDMASTVANHAAYLASEDEWMLNRLIMPASRLGEFEKAAEALLPRGEEDEPWLISALTAPAGDAAALKADLARIEAFNDAHGLPKAGLAMIDVIEMPADSAEAIEAALDTMPDELFPFFELPAGTDPRGMITTLVGGEAGAKIRTGGEMAEAYPAADELARFIVACASADVPYKATAGLHHPLRHHAAGMGVKAFGFLNVFAAAALALHRELPVEEVVRVLEEEEAEAFVFDDEKLRWRHQRVGVEEIEDARLRQAVSFGSCSFDEPREGLRRLGLL